MSNLWTPPEGDTPTVRTPFGPPIGHMKLSSKLVRQLNLALTVGKTDGSIVDWSDNLVGKVTEELTMAEPEANKVLQEIQPLIQQYVGSAYLRKTGRQMDNTKQYGLSVEGAWYVRQFEGEFNPTHIHTDCNLSCVGYLMLPNGIESEWEEDYKDHHPCKGHIQFTYGNDSKFSNATVMIKPQVGDFYLFPSDLWHTVYPFSTKGERRSFSMNMKFGEVDA